MDIREKLIEILRKPIFPHELADTTEAVADYLLDSGVTVQEDCKDCAEATQNCIVKLQEQIAELRSVQELDGCKYCKEYEDLPEHFIEGKPIGRVFDTCIQPNENGLWHIEVPCGADIGIRFCPMCGRRLPQPTKGE